MLSSLGHCGVCSPFRTSLSLSWGHSPVPQLSPGNNRLYDPECPQLRSPSQLRYTTSSLQRCLPSLLYHLATRRPLPCVRLDRLFRPLSATNAQKDSHSSAKHYLVHKFLLSPSSLLESPLA